MTPLTSARARALALTLAPALAPALALAVGCYTGPDSTLSPIVPADANADAPPPPSRDIVDPSDRLDSGAVAAEGGLPCDVADLLTTSCARCHGTFPTHGATISLVTYDDLVAPWDEDPTRTIAEVSLKRMKATTKPMPPEGRLAASAVSVFEAWVGNGMARATCASDRPARDGGAASGSADAAPAPDVPSAPDAGVCTNGASTTTWIPGAAGSPLMFPGTRCLACHAASGARSLTLAGTVYPTLHEPDDCVGTGSNVSVVIVDAVGKSHTVPVNAAGNFVRVTSVPMPYTARVVSGTKVREMTTPQTDGDCNGCHSALAAQSPGRIMAP